jgi:Uma2 family endonuclease
MRYDARMAGAPLHKRQRFTWADLLTWPDDERWEIIGGEAFDMSPPPSSRHPIVSMRLGVELAGYFRGKRCQPYAAPFSVKLADEDVVQPDLFVICSPRQIKRTHIEGAPKLVIEILSESTQRHDRVTKYRLYEKHGVKEYWLVQPYPSLVEVYVLRRGKYELHGGYEKHETLRSPTFRGLRVPLKGVFDFPLEPGEEVQTVRESTPPYPARRRR